MYNSLRVGKRVIHFLQSAHLFGYFFRRDANNRHVGRNILCHYGSSADNGIFANCDIWEKGGVIADFRPLFYMGSLQLIRLFPHVFVIGHGHAWTDKYIVFQNGISGDISQGLNGASFSDRRIQLDDRPSADDRLAADRRVFADAGVIRNKNMIGNFGTGINCHVVADFCIFSDD